MKQRRKKQYLWILPIILIMISFSVYNQEFKDFPEVIYNEIPDEAYDQEETSIPSENDEVSQDEDEEKSDVIVFSPEELKQVKENRAYARVRLAAMYTAQASWEAEFTRYSSDIKSAGIRPDGAVLKIKYGYLGSFQPEDPFKWDGNIEDPSFNSTDEFILRDRTVKNERYRYLESIEKVQLRDFKEFCKNGCGVGKDFFEALAVFPYPNGKGYEVWVINEKKELRKVFSGKVE